VPAGVYTVNVLDLNSCTAQGNVTLTDPSTLTTSFINKQEITCANAIDGSVEVQVSGGTPPVSFTWSNSATTSLVNNLAPGAYQVTTSDNNGCSTVMNISFAAPPTIEILLLAIDPVSCPAYTDGTIQVSAIGGTPGQTTAYQYSIDGTNFQTSEFFQNLSAGNYTIIIRDSQGCLKDTTIQVLEPAVLDLLVLPTDSTIDLGNSITLVSSVSNYTPADINYYSWSPLSGLNCSDCATAIATPYYTTDFTLTVNYLDNCSVSETVRVNVGDGEDFYVPNAFSPNGDGNNDVLEVYGRGLAKVDLTIFNRWGEKVFDSNNQWQGWDGNYKGIESPAGVYTYYVEAIYLNGKTKEKKGTITIIR
jgi:gliding motility-associated-like protein